MDRQGLKYPFILTMSLVYFANAQSCPPIAVNDLGNTTAFSSAGHLPLALRPPGGEAGDIPVRIMNYHIVCDASGMSRNTSSFVSVLVQFQCDFPSGTGTLADCDGNTNVTRQYQFSCNSQTGEWNAGTGDTDLFVQTLNPTATFMTPLDNQCRRCIDDQQRPNTPIDPTTHCEPCGAECNQGQERCFIGLSDQCCNFYLEDECVAECPSPLVNDSNYDCGCGLLSLDNGDVNYTKGLVVGSVATHTCNPGYQLLPQGGEIRSCTRDNGWGGQNIMCVRALDVTAVTNISADTISKSCQCTTVIAFTGVLSVVLTVCVIVFTTVIVVLFRSKNPAQPVLQVHHSHPPPVIDMEMNVYGIPELTKLNMVK